MLFSSMPAKFQAPFAFGAGPSFIRPIPLASQIPIQGGAASLTDGFPPLTFQPISSGGIPPFGQDFNGLFNQSTAWNQWFSVGGAIYYDPTIQAQIGGYPRGAIVQSLVVDGTFWMSIADNNLNNPDAAGIGAGWVLAPGLAMPGDLKWRASPPPSGQGWVLANGLTLGNASSGATGFASSQTLLLFRNLWNNFSNTQCPVTPGGRGATADADFAANKTIGLLDFRGIGMIGVDAMGGTSATGLLNGVPIVSGSTTTLGSVLGENLHTLLIAEIAAHNHGGVSGIMSANNIHNHGGATGGMSGNITHDHGGATGAMNTNQSHAHGVSGGTIGGTSSRNWSIDDTTGPSGAAGIIINPTNIDHVHPIATVNLEHVHGINSVDLNHTHTIASQGGGGSHNNVQRSMTCYVFMKL